MSDVISRHATINTVHEMRKKCDTDSIDDYEEMLTMALNELCTPQRIGRCKDCLMHGICRFEQGLGLDRYCSQWQRMEDSE